MSGARSGESVYVLYFSPNAEDVVHNCYHKSVSFIGSFFQLLRKYYFYQKMD